MPMPSLRFKFKIGQDMILDINRIVYLGTVIFLLILGV